MPWWNLKQCPQELAGQLGGSDLPVPPNERVWLDGHEGAVEYRVRRLCACRRARSGELEWLVSWWDTDEASWQPDAQVRADVPGLVEEWESSGMGLVVVPEAEVDDRRL